MMRKIGLALAGVAAAALLLTPSAQAAHSPKLTVPAPTGKYAVGTTTLHLVDQRRQDPWQSKPTPRELMVSVWYPAKNANGGTKASYTGAGAAADFAAANPDISGGVKWQDVKVRAREGAPVAGGRARPVVLYSPGAGDPRSWGTTLVSDLASRGYVVVTIDHTYEAFGVQFPDGRVAHSVLPDLIKPGMDMTPLLKKVMDTRTADTRFVLDELQDLHNGQNPDADHRPVVRGLPGALDLNRVGMFGHSAGGFTTAMTMHDDPRIKAGVDLDGLLSYSQEDDGTNFSPVATDGLSRPFLLLGSGEYGPAAKRPSWNSFLQHSTGFKQNVTLDGTQHGSFTDAEAMVPQLKLDDSVRTNLIGSANSKQCIAAVRNILAGFFGHRL